MGAGHSDNDLTQVIVTIHDVRVQALKEVRSPLTLAGNKAVEGEVVSLKVKALDIPTADSLDFLGNCPGQVLYRAIARHTRLRILVGQ
jgi:hypothetical protein